MQKVNFAYVLRYIYLYMTNMMILISTLSIFHSRQVLYHLTLHMVFTSCSLLHIQDAAHTMIISDIAIKC